MDCWNHLVFATTGRDVIVYLLDEEERDNNDIPLQKIIMPSEVILINIQEVEWNECKLTVVGLNTEIKQFLIT